MHFVTAQLELFDDIADLFKSVSVVMLLPHVVCHDKERRFLEQQHLKYLILKEHSRTTAPKISDFKVQLSGTPTPKVSDFKVQLSGTPTPKVSEFKLLIELSRTTAPKVSVQILVIHRSFDTCAHVIQTKNML